METLENIFLFTKAESIGGVAVRGLVWIFIVLIVAIGIDRGKKIKHIKVDLGWFLLLLLTVAILSLVIFGVFPTF